MSAEDFDPNDLDQRACLYKTEEGPHEPSAFVRLSQYGWPTSVISKMFNKSVTVLTSHFSIQREVRDSALKDGRALHDKQAPKGAK